VLQALRRRVEEAAEGSGDGAASAPALRLGFTVTRKVGGAVVRNRARRRLRAAAETVLKEAMPAGWDLVVIARAETPTRPFALLCQDLRRALDRTGVRPAPKARGAAPEPDR